MKASTRESESQLRVRMLSASSEIRSATAAPTNAVRVAKHFYTLWREVPAARAMSAIVVAGNPSRAKHSRAPSRT
jgi:hypothetical protein